MPNLPSCLFTSGFASITLCATLLFPLLATDLAHLLHLDLIIMQSPPVPVTSLRQRYLVQRSVHKYTEIYFSGGHESEKYSF